MEREQITTDMKQQLADLVQPFSTAVVSFSSSSERVNDAMQGYDRSEVRNMTPAQAVEIIAAGRPPPPRIPQSPSMPRCAATSGTTSAATSVAAPSPDPSEPSRSAREADTVLLYSLALATPRVSGESSSSSKPPASASPSAPPQPSSPVTALALTGHLPPQPQ